jgi:5-formyltetrahydrofolate cyclo-ligase
MEFPTPQDKPTWRREMKRRWRETCPEDRSAATAELAESLRPWLNQHPGLILWFSPLPDEPDLRALAAELAATGHSLALPRVVGNDLHVHPWNGQTTRLVSGCFGILEPDPSLHPACPASVVDVALLPGLAFDPVTGVRLGRGAGYYDRWLANSGFRGIAVGLALPWQLAGPLPREAHDRPMDRLATASGVIRPG